MFTSLDTWGKPAEYIRTGLDLEVWEKNFHTYLTNTPTPITFMVTFNILTVTNFKSLLIKFLEWRKQYGWYDHLREHKIRFDTPYLKEPLQYDMNILPKDQFMPYMHDALEFMKQNVDNNSSDKFTELEYEKFRRVVDYMQSTNYDNNKIKEGRTDFHRWFTEFDRRRGTSFLETFPEYKQFFLDCKKI
jgi:hypothetical protein